MLCLLSSYSQNISGTVLNETNEPIEQATIIIKEKIEDNLILAYTTTNTAGKFNLEIDENLTSFSIEIKSFSFVTKSIEITDFASKVKPIIFNVQLKEELTELEEVYIQSDRRAIVVKNDTTIFNPEKFMDGNERVVEDLIKKLPGMKVENDGRITFKGKAVESLLLDGDDLFDANYTIGTKNIDVAMVDKLSAIENYIKNPLLHGIDQSNAVAINLTLKKGITDFSSNNNVGIGVENSYDINSNILGVSKTLKSFTTASYNNVGKETSPYDYFSSNNVGFKTNTDRQLKIPKILNGANFNSDIATERSRINNNLFASVNSIYNVSNKMGVKLNIDYKNDALKRDNFSEINYLSPLDSLNRIEEEGIIKKPAFIKSTLKNTYKLSENSLLEYEGKFSLEDIATNIHQDVNGAAQGSAINNKEHIFKNTLSYTKRLTKKSALFGELVVNRSKLNEDVRIAPDSRLNNATSNQKIAINNKSILASTYYLLNLDKFNTKIGAGYVREEISFFSDLNSNFLALSTNNFEYTTTYPWLETTLSYSLQNWKFKTKLLFRQVAQGIENRNTLLTSDAKNFEIIPNAEITYSINKKSSLRLFGSYNQEILGIENYFENIIFTSNTNSLKNNQSFETLDSQNISLTYNYNDFFNLFQFYSGISYNYNPNNFFYDYTITSSFTENTRTLLDLDATSYSINGGVDTFINFLNSNVKLNTAYSINKYKNRINNAEIRENSANSLFTDINLKTGFLGILNFENSFQFINTKFKTAIDETPPVSNNSFVNSFKTYLNPKKNIRFVVGADYYIPSSINKNEYLFFDTLLTITSKNKKIEYSLISKNISAKGNLFQTNYISDFSTTKYSYTIVEPYILLSLNFKL